MHSYRTNRRPWHSRSNKTLLAAHPLPASIIILSPRSLPSSFLSPCATFATASPLPRCPTTHAGSRCRCRRSASSCQEDRDPRAHRLRQATASTPQRNRNAPTPALSHRHSPHHHAPPRCASMSNDPKAQAGWQTPRHLRQAASLGRQRLTPKASTTKSWLALSNSSRRQATVPTC